MGNVVGSNLNIADWKAEELIKRKTAIDAKQGFVKKTDMEQEENKEEEKQEEGNKEDPEEKQEEGKSNKMISRKSRTSNKGI